MRSYLYWSLSFKDLPSAVILKVATRKHRRKNARYILRRFNALKELVMGIRVTYFCGFLSRIIFTYPSIFKCFTYAIFEIRMIFLSHLMALNRKSIFT